ncbi:HD domain-containing protein [Halobiforma nitratireducens]|uniref:5'-deoxynucleotidase n=1 Tax=Halobiforma nitratireducens JCM 10879 TaxID=1227454 RepID=M0M673_9EURY|nr:HD family hydrolase [Halobiforma nitratireducens]EMA39875.1 hypothetical protein C446_08149 [Halobiforma nitratireducens JCM 10879]
MSDDLEALLEWIELKDERRTGWELRNVDAPESVAAHTWGTATLCLLYADEVGVDIDRDRAVAMALVHDLGEARTGDVATRADAGQQRVSPAEKEAAERDAVTDLTEPFEDRSVPLCSLWEEYEDRETATARFVKDMDLIDNCLQALKYERTARYEERDSNEHFDEFDGLDEFFATAVGRLRTDIGKSLFERIKTQYEDEIGRSCQLSGGESA